MRRLSDGLFEQARELAARAGDEIALRRAVSAAYYALYHALIETACERLFGGAAEDEWSQSVAARCFDHGAIRETCKEYLRDRRSARFAKLLKPGQDADLAIVANNFPELQHKRHIADYEASIVFKAQEAAEDLDVAAMTLAALRRAASAPDMTQLHAFCLAMFLQRQYRA